MEEKRLVCAKCKVALEEGPVDFHYMGHGFSAKILRCPKCGYVYITEDLVNGRIHDVEINLEDK